MIKPCRRCAAIATAGRLPMSGPAEKFGDDAIVRGRGLGVKLEHQGPSNTR